MEVCNILGVNIAVTNMNDTVEYIKSNLEDLKGNYICVSNVHTTVMSYDNEEYMKIQNGGALALPDGGPLSTIGRKKGYKNMERTTGPNLMEEIFGLETGYKHFFYGSTEDTIKKLENELKSQYPNIKICGMYSPPFRHLTEEEDIEIIKMINETKPDFVWVGLGAPKQEQWMSEHKNKIKGLMIGVGAGFDYFAGNISRAPRWMQRSNLEWLYRLMQDPKRLLKRYLYTNSKFIWLILTGK